MSFSFFHSLVHAVTVDCILTLICSSKNWILYPLNINIILWHFLWLFADDNDSEDGMVTWTPWSITMPCKTNKSPSKTLY